VAGAPVARIKGRLLHGAFQLASDERAALAQLDFCRVEVIGLAPRASNEPARREPALTAADSTPGEAQAGPRFVDCQSPVLAAADKMEVTLPNDLGLVSGQPLRLARRRYDTVFPVPAAALVAGGPGQSLQSLWIADRDGTAEPRAVAVADVSDDALVSGGLRIGDRVIVDPPADLRAGTRIALAR